MTHVRPLGEPDLHAYAALRREMLADSPWSFSSSPEIDVGCDPARHAQRLAEPGQALFGGFDNAGSLIGSLGLRRETNPKMAHRAFIWGVYVQPAHRRRGVADALVRVALEYARTLPGLAWVGLTVSERAPGARRLYERHGFIAWGTEPDALRVDGISVHETHMRWAL